MAGFKALWITGIPHFIMLHFIALHRPFFFQIEGKAFHQQKDYGLLYCGGLESNLQHLRGMPLVGLEFVVFYYHHGFTHSQAHTAWTGFKGQQ